MSQESVKLRLELEVEYFSSGVGKNELGEMLEYIATYAAGEGLMTRDTPAEVNQWTARVRDMDTGGFLFELPHIGADYHEHL